MAFRIDTAEHSILGQLLKSPDPALESFADLLMQRYQRPSPARIGLALLAALLASLVVVQSLALTLASRNKRAFADLGACLAAIFLLVLAGRRLLDYGAHAVGVHWLLPLCVILFLLGIAAAWRSFSAGALVEQAHRRYSRVMGPGLVALALAVLVAAHGTTLPRVERLRKFDFAIPSADGSRWLVGGPTATRGFEPVYWVEPATRQVAYLADRRQILGEPWLSEDGGRALFEHSVPPDVALDVAEFGEDGLARQLALLNVGQRFGPDWINDGGEPMVMSERGGLEIYSLDGTIRRFGFSAFEDSKRVLARRRPGGTFDLLVEKQVYSQVQWTMQRFTFDPATGQLEPGETWSVNDGKRRSSEWWLAALPLLDAGAPLDALASKALVAGARQRLHGDGGARFFRVERSPPLADPRFPRRPGRQLRALQCQLGGRDPAGPPAGRLR